MVKSGFEKAKQNLVKDVEKSKLALVFKPLFKFYLLDQWKYIQYTKEIKIIIDCRKQL